tara:strand:- start:120 stop:1229 length:1110 start_codon:yes stop_codon:yes gene_type:complete
VIKKVYLYYPSFEKGGATKVLINITNYFLKKKVNIYLISYRAKKKYFIRSKKLKIIKIKKIWYLGFLPMRWNLAIASMFKLYFFSRLQKDKSIIFSMQSHLLAILVSKITNCKIVIRNSEEIFGATKYADKKLIALIVLFLKIIFYNFANHIIAISERSKNSLNKIVINKKKISLIYNPYLENIQKPKKKIKLNKNFSIISIGRFTKQKNFLGLINSIINLSKKYNFVKLTIIGEGEQFPILKNKIKNIKNIKLLKWNNNLSKYFKASNLFILNSYYEGLPNILIDAINYEVPSISTDVSGASDILMRNKGGTLVKVNDEKDLERKIELAIKNYPIFMRKIKIAKKNINRFTIKNIFLFEKLFNRMSKY